MVSARFGQKKNKDRLYDIKHLSIKNLSLVLLSINYTERHETDSLPRSRDSSAPPRLFDTERPRRLCNGAACFAVGGVRARRSYVLAVHLWTRQAQRSSQREVLTGPRRSSRTRRGPHYRDLARRHIKQDKALAIRYWVSWEPVGPFSLCNTGTVFTRGFSLLRTGGAA